MPRAVCASYDLLMSCMSISRPIVNLQIFKELNRTQETSLLQQIPSSTPCISPVHNQQRSARSPARPPARSRVAGAPWLVPPTASLGGSLRPRATQELGGGAPLLSWWVEVGRLVFSSCRWWTATGGTAWWMQMLGIYEATGSPQVILTTLLRYDPFEVCVISPT